VPDRAAWEETRAVCRRALEDSPALRPLWRAWRSGDGALAEARALLPSVRPVGSAVPRLVHFKQALAQSGVPVGDGAFERFLIVSAAADAAGRIEALPVDGRVKELFLRNFEAYAAGATPEPFDLARASFVAMARIATLSRFPAGQLDWVVSGIPRSWLIRADWRALPRLARSLLFELRGFGPAFFSHLNPNRRNQGVLLERESLRSYHRMARSMELQPEIRGFVTASWLHSPDTFAVSPHLAWLNEVFLRNGGAIVPLGRVDADCGVLHRSPERQQAYDAGTFVPTEALVIWPRRAMLAWARGHDELRDDVSARRPMLAAQGARA
jgi:hypothetical protein